MSVTRITKKTLSFYLAISQIYLPYSVYATDAVHDDVNYLHQRYISKMVVQSKLDDLGHKEQQLVDCHTVIPNAQSVFKLSLDPSLYIDNSLLILVHNNSPIGTLVYAGQELYFWGAQDHNFEIMDWGQTQQPLPMKLLLGQINGTLILTGQSTADNMQLQAQKLIINNTVEAKQSFSSQTLSDLEITGSLTSPAIQLVSKNLKHQGSIHCTHAFMNIENHVEHSPQSLIQTEQNLTFKGFKNFSHQGDIRAKNSIIIQGDDYDATVGSSVFTGVLYHVDSKTYKANGRVTAWQHWFKSQVAEFEKDFWFSGQTVLGKTTKLLDIRSQAFFRMAQAAQFQSDNRLLYYGSIHVIPSLTLSFPYWEYTFGPSPFKKLSSTAQNLLKQPLSRDIEVPAQARNKDFQPALKTIKSDVDRVRQSIQKDIKGIKGILLEAKGTLKHQGIVHSDVSSVDYKATNLMFKGESQSGFLESNQTLIQASHAYCDGWLKAPVSISFSITDNLQLKGLLQTALAKISSSHITLSGNVEGALFIFNNDSTIISNKISGSVLEVLSKNFILMPEAKIQIKQDIKVDSENVVLAGKIHTDNLEVKATTAHVKPDTVVEVDTRIGFEIKQTLKNFGKMWSQGTIDLKVNSYYELGDMLARKWFTLESEQLSSFNQILKSNELAFTRNGGLHLISDKPQLINIDMDVPYALAFTAPTMRTVATIRSQKDIALQTTHGDLYIDKPMAAQNIFLSSAGGLRNTHMSTTKDNTIMVQGGYSNYGRIKSLFGDVYIQAGAALNAAASTIEGNNITVKSLIGDIDNKGLIEGQNNTIIYSQAHFKNLSKISALKGNLAIQASDITNVSPTSVISGNMINLQASHGGITNYGHISSTYNHTNEAKKAYKNFGKVLAIKGDLSIQSSEILNATPANSIEGQRVLLQSQQGDIVNYGTIKGSDYLQIQAAGNILNMATVYRHGTPWFRHAQMLGGTGIDYMDDKGNNRKLGLKMEAQGRIDNYVSDIKAVGDVFVFGKKGVSHCGDVITYVAEHYTTRSGFLGHKKQTHTVWKSVVGQPILQSLQGRIVTSVPEGGLDYIGCYIKGAQGDIASVQGDIRYGALIAQNRHDVQSSSWWGLSYSSDSQQHQSAVITKIINGSMIHHESLLKGIQGQGVYIQAPIYKARAPEKIIFDGVKLHHHIHQDSHSILPSFFGFQTLDAAMNGHSVPEALLREDPFINKLVNYKEPDNKTDQIMDTVKKGIKGVKYFKKLGKLYLESEGDFNWKDIVDNIKDWAFERYGDVGVTLNQSSFDHHYTTTVPPRFNVSILDIESGQGIELNDGAQVRVEKLMRIRTPYLRVSAAIDESHTHQESNTLELGMNVMTKVPYMSVQHKDSSSYSKKHRNANIKIYGKNGMLDVGNLQNFYLDGANISTASIMGSVKNMYVTTYQDIFESSKNSWKIKLNGIPEKSLKGGFDIAASHKHKLKTKKSSNLVVRNDFDDNFILNNLVVSDKQLDPALAKIAQRTTFHKLYDVNQSSGYKFGLSGLNLNSPQLFAQSFGKGVVLGTAGYLGTEIAQKAGLNPESASLVGFGTSALTSSTWNVVDKTYFPAVDKPTKGVGIKTVGKFTKHNNKQHIRFEILDLDVNENKLKADWQMMQDVGAKLKSDTKKYFN